VAGRKHYRLGAVQRKNRNALNAQRIGAGNSLVALQGCGDASWQAEDSHRRKGHAVSMETTPRRVEGRRVNARQSVQQPRCLPTMQWRKPG